MSLMHPPRTKAQWRNVQRAAVALAGLAGWGIVSWFSWQPPAALRQGHVDLPFLACLVLAIAARLLAVPMVGGIRVALDSMLYIATAFILGVIPAAWMVLAVLTVDRALRMSADRPWVDVLYGGGLPALTLLVLGWGFGIDGGHPYDIPTLLWLLPLFAQSFVTAHYFLASSSYWLEGGPSSDAWRHFWRVAGYELALLPLGLAMVLGVESYGTWSIVLLGACFMVFNILFRRAMIAREDLGRRVEELSTLNKVGRQMAATLDRRLLVGHVVHATLRLVGESSLFTLGLQRNDEHIVDLEVYDATGERIETLFAPWGKGLSGWIMRHRQPLLLGDLQSEFHQYCEDMNYNDPQFHSYLGVPLIVYDEVVGVMSVQSRLPHAFTTHHLRVLSSVADIAIVALENARLYDLATIDGLTDLLVRRHFDQRLEEEWVRALRYGSGFAVGILDLDDFKKLNDSYGHQAGDHVLRAAAAVVRENMRAADLAGRYGGEEFAFILPRTSLDEAVHMAERIREDIAALRVYDGNKALRITASIGISSYPESGAMDHVDLVARADAALYQAKREGKNCVRIAALDSASDVA